MTDVPDDDDYDPIALTLETKRTLVFVHGAFDDGASRLAAAADLGDHCPWLFPGHQLQGEDDVFRDL